MDALFPLGRVVATPGALEALAASGVSPAQLLTRHQTGDWGEVPPEDAKENERSVKDGFRIFSSYAADEGASGPSPRPTGQAPACCYRPNTTAGCGDIDPSKLHVCTGGRERHQTRWHVRHHACGSTTLKSAVGTGTPRGGRIADPAVCSWNSEEPPPTRRTQSAAARPRSARPRRPEGRRNHLLKSFVCSRVGLPGSARPGRPIKSSTGS
jgi:hypothetical protein